MTKKAIVKDTLTQKFKQMYSSEIVPILEQKKQLYVKINELYEKINELYEKKSELYAKISELYAKINELYAKKSELYAKIFWKFVKFEKANDCKVEWNNGDYDFRLENIEVKSNAEIEAEKIKKVPETIEHDGHQYKLIS